VPARSARNDGDVMSELLEKSARWMRAQA